MKTNRKFLGCALAISVMSSGVMAAKPAQVADGSTVSMHYTLTVDGQVVDSSVGKPPLVYVQGSGQIIPGLEEEMRGMKKGDKKKVSVVPEKGYGPVNPQAIETVSRKKIPNGKDIKVGSVLTGSNQNGQPVQAKVVAAKGDKITVDFNHPLAGKTLNFDVEVVDVKPKGK